MLKINKDIFLSGIGIFLIILSVAGIIINIITKTPYNIVWLCNHTSLIIGLAFIFRSSFWVTAELNVAFFPQLLWSIDFLSRLLFNKHVFGFTDYMFSPHYPRLLYILSWNHVFMLPIALIGLYFLELRKDAWKGSVLHGVLLIPLSYIFAYGTNLNCMHQPCVPFIPTTPLYKIYWPPLFLIIAILPTNFLIQWFYKKIKRKK